MSSDNSRLIDCHVHVSILIEWDGSTASTTRVFVCLLAIDLLE